jgi:triphosphoribosyl-dephospho-CoA synthetase
MSIKHFLMHIEETHPLGRFIDLDVYNHPDKSISRMDIGAPLRTCMLCEEPAILCMRYEKHSIDDMLFFIEKETHQFLLQDIKKQIDLSILTELELEDKFGLVTKTSSGSHPDMDYALMVKAKDAIIDDLIDIFELGLRAENLEGLFLQAKNIGIKAEKGMLDATQGINCYKGLITVLGFACLASGYALSHQDPFMSIFSHIKTLSKDLHQDFDKPLHTFGIKAFQTHQITGIRGECQKGLSTIQKILDVYPKLTKDDPLTLRKALRDLIVLSEDTVFLKRSKSFERYQKIKAEIQTLNLDDSKQIKVYTNNMIKENISFGGSADLLVTAIYLQHIKHLFN